LSNSINNSDLQHSVQSFIEFFPNQTILLAGSAMRDYRIKETDKLINLQDVADLLSFLNQVDMTYASVS
jgi:hypothetical protein